MKRETRRLGTAAAALLPLVMTFGGYPSPAAGEPVTLTMVGAWPPGVSPAADIGIHFKDVVNRLADGKLVIEFKGASDVIPTFDQPEALVRGVFDVWYGAPNYWAGVVPGGYLTELSAFATPDQGPGSDLFAFLVDMYAEHGVRYLGHFSGEPDSGNHYMYTQEEVSGIGDLEGLKIRVPPLTRFFVEQIGAEPVTLPPGEIYLALERGAVDGFTWPFFDGFTNFGWQEVSKYVILHPLYRDGTSINMNLEKWNSLTPEVQEIVLEAVRETQEWAPGWVSEVQASQLAAMKDGGMSTIEFSPEEAERWRETADAALWQHFESVMSPDEYATARKLLEAE